MNTLASRQCLTHAARRWMLTLPSSVLHFQLQGLLQALLQQLQRQTRMWESSQFVVLMALCHQPSSPHAPWRRLTSSQVGCEDCFQRCLATP